MQVRAENLAMHYNDAGAIIPIFSNLQMTVKSGTSMAIIGESGVGKTTLLNLLGGLERPADGDVHIGESCITRDFPNPSSMAAFRGKHIGFIFQFFQLLPEFSAVENVAMPLLFSGYRMKIALRESEMALERVGLKSRLHHRPTMLSGGEQQRVAIARALIIKPGVILADEPTGNLDHKTGAAVCKLLKEIQEDYNTTLIVVTHSQEIAGLMHQVVELTPNGLLPVG